jgi:ABC-three component (ABC-3C) system Middle Component 5
MTDYRIWHSSRDPYHCAFRIISLLKEDGGAIRVEKLRILDMFFLYPPLLYRLSLPNEQKSNFRKLKITHPNKYFIRLPGTAAIWQDLQVFQSTALKQLTGRGLLRRDSLRDHRAHLMLENVPQSILQAVESQRMEEKYLLSFLIKDVGNLPVTGPKGLVRRAGIPARGPIL